MRRKNRLNRNRLNHSLLIRKRDGNPGGEKKRDSRRKKKDNDNIVRAYLSSI